MPPRTQRQPRRASLRGPRPQSIVHSDTASASSASSTSSPALSDITSVASCDTLDTLPVEELDDLAPLPCHHSSSAGASVEAQTFSKPIVRSKSIRLSLQPKGPRARSNSATLRFPQPPQSAPLCPSESFQQAQERFESSPPSTSSQPDRSNPTLPCDRLGTGYQRVFSQDYNGSSDDWMHQTIDWDAIHDALLSSPIDLPAIPCPPPPPPPLPHQACT